jgi:iron complex outermembrane recepter protein
MSVCTKRFTGCRGWKAALLATTIVGSSTAALAQSTQAPVANGSQVQTVEEVTVTAEKQSEKSLDVPMGLTALSGEDLTRNQQFSFQDYVGTVPGLNMSTFGGIGSQIVIRGLSAGLQAVNPGAAIYLDDTPYSVQGYFAGSYGSAPNLDTYDMSNIEVLKGPQGTLYGADALGGLLKYVTNAPDPSGFAASVMAGTSTVYNGGVGFDVHGMVNIPLTDDLAVRVVAYEDYLPGFIDNPFRGLKDINGSHETGGRASLLWEPTSDFSMRLTGVYQDLRYSDFSSEYVSGPTGSPYPSATNPCVQAAGCPDGPLTENNYTSQPGYSLNDVASLTSKWNAGPMDVTAITSYSRFVSKGIWDYSAIENGATGIGTVNASSSLGGTVGNNGYTPTGASTPSAQYGHIPQYGSAVSQVHAANTWTQELRFQSPDPSARLTWLAGGYFETEQADEIEYLHPVTVATGAINYAYYNPYYGAGYTPNYITNTSTNPTCTAVGTNPCATGGGPNPYSLLYQNFATSYEEFAGFGNVDYKILPTLDAALGGRYSTNNSTFHETAIGLLAGVDGFGEAATEHTVTYSGDLRWHFIPDNMAYVRLASGFVPGGGNDITPNSGVLPVGFSSTYGPSTTKNYELGVKGTLFDGRVTYDMDVYHINWESIQIQVKFTPPGGTAHTSITNGGTAHSQGFEWDYAYVPIDGLTLRWDGDYSNAIIAGDTLAAVALGAVPGATLPYAPMWQTSASINYEQPLWGDWAGFVAADLRYSDSSLSSFIVVASTTNNGQRAYVPAWTMLDFHLGIENGKYSATLYCKNCTNVITPDGEQAWNGSSSGAGYQNAAVYTPRTIGVELAAKF